MNTTIIIAVKDRLRNLRYCLSSMHQCNPPPNHVIVIDFGSNRPISGYTKRFDFVEVIRVTRNTNKFHKARALNIGIRAADTKFICITDADQIFQKNFFGVLNRTLEKNPNSFIKCITHFLPNADQLPKQPSQISACYPRILQYAKKFGKKPFGEGNCNGVLRKWAVDVHGYDERYIGWGYEDSNFHIRALRSGKEVVWLSKFTSMVHLPHARDPDYFHMPSIQKSLSMFKNTPQPTVANADNAWGQL